MDDNYYHVNTYITCVRCKQTYKFNHIFDLDYYKGKDRIELTTPCCRETVYLPIMQKIDPCVWNEKRFDHDHIPDLKQKVEIIEKLCTCSSRDLFHFGCKCGGK